MVQKFKLPTTVKVKIAFLISSFILIWCKTFRLPWKNMRLKRGGFQWSLNLEQGIDLAIFLFGKFEENSQRALKKLVKPSMIVFDVGANIGAHTFLLGSLTSKGHTYAIEPTEYAFNKLKQNLALNPALKDSVTCFQYGFLEDDRKTQDSLVSSWNLHLQSESGALAGQFEKTKGAKFCSFDSFIENNNIQQVDFIKVDIDGFEADFLKGALKTLSSHHPQILIELCPHALETNGKSLEDIITPLRNLGYRFFDESHFTEITMDSEKIHKMIPNQGGINVIASTQVLQ